MRAGERAERALLVCASLLLEASRSSLASGPPPPCARGVTWWDARAASCVACTACEPARRLAVLRPCEPHRDALCVPLHRLHIQWPPRPTARDEGTIDLTYDDGTYEREGSAEAEESSWDARGVALALAASGCIIFFLIVICLPLYHTRQWRRLKQTLERDVQDLSARMRLVECGPAAVAAEAAAAVEATSSMQPRNPLPAHHFYANIPHATAGKDHLLGDLSRKGSNNVYTQDKLPS